MIRRILPKGTSFKDLDPGESRSDDESHKFLHKKKAERPVCTPVVQLPLGDDVAEKLHSQPVDADEINLTPELLK